ncbi:MAG: hypothetical protein HRT47_14215 [Candidatus Caenarcaniphilales bacterium]|nr:hypothetical protein [Candidatus Caenarcaniphilales bacterium]
MWVLNSHGKAFLNQDYNLEFTNNIIYNTTDKAFEDFSEISDSNIENNFLLNIEGDAYKFTSSQAFKAFNNNFAMNINGSALNFDIEDNTKFISLKDSNYNLDDLESLNLLSETEASLLSKKYKLSQLPVAEIDNFNAYKARKGISINSLSRDDDSFDRNLRAHSLVNKFKNINLVKILGRGIEVKRSSRVAFEDLEVLGTPNAQISDKRTLSR